MSTLPKVIQSQDTNTPSLISTVSLTGLSICLLNSGGTAWGPPSQQSPCPVLDRGRLYRDPKGLGAGLSPSLLVPPLERELGKGGKLCSLLAGEAGALS